MLDCGCGYGALRDFPHSLRASLRYKGFDVSLEMITRHGPARAPAPAAVFTAEADLLGIHDFVVASGMFNVKLEANEESWQAYVFAALDQPGRLVAARLRLQPPVPLTRTRSGAEAISTAGTPYFDRCKRLYSARVALLHDYPLWDQRRGPPG